MSAPDPNVAEKHEKRPVGLSTNAIYHAAQRYGVPQSAITREFIDGAMAVGTALGASTIEARRTWYGFMGIRDRFDYSLRIDRLDPFVIRLVKRLSYPFLHDYRLAPYVRNSVAYSMGPLDKLSADFRKGMEAGIKERREQLWETRAFSGRPSLRKRVALVPRSAIVG